MNNPESNGSVAGDLDSVIVTPGQVEFALRAGEAQDDARIITIPSFALNSSLSAATVGSNYQDAIGGTGGTAPYGHFVLTGGALPPGLTLSSNGVISGVPTADGYYNFSVQATDSSTWATAGPFTATQSYNLYVNQPTIAIEPPNLPDAYVGVSYSQTVVASGGTAPYSYVVTSGALPPGFSLASNGVVTGTPNSTGTYTFTVQATDSSGGDGPFTGTQNYTLNVLQPAVTSVVVNGNLPLFAGVQRSMVEDIVYSFNMPVNLDSNAFSIVVHSGQAGTVPVLNWNPVSGTDNMEWAVAFADPGNNTVIGGSIANGVYDITLNAPSVTSVTGGSESANSRTDTFFRLFGDINGDGRVNNTDNSAFNAALNGAYVAAFDYYNDGYLSSALDAPWFNMDFNLRYKGFTATI